VAKIDSTDEVVRSYLIAGQRAASNAAGDLSRHPGRVPGSKPVLRTVTVRDTQGRATAELLEPSFTIDVGFDVGTDGPSLSGIGFILEAEDGGRVGSYNTYMSQPSIEKLPREGVVRFQVESPILLAGWYTLSVSAGFHQSQIADKVEAAVRFWMGPIDPYGAGYIPNPSLGVVALTCRTRLLESPSGVGCSPAQLR
jgi:hypothetical protein